MLDIHTFDQRQGGNVLYKALSHPLVADAIARLFVTLQASGPVAVVDTDGIATVLFSLHPNAPPIEGIYVQDVRDVGLPRAGHITRPLTALAAAAAASVLVAAFDTARLAERLRMLSPSGARLASLDDVRLPQAMLTNPSRYLDRLNFATNYAFFREQDGLSTTLVTANYWSGYGAGDVRLWLRLFDAAGHVLAEWEEPVRPGAASLRLDSRTLRERFRLPEFTGQLFIHAIGVAGHDVVKYALDTYSTGPSLSCTHDANAWPAERYAGLPAPDTDEQVTLWVQNCHAVPIPSGALSLDRMGADRPVAITRHVPAYASVAVDVAAILPGIRWPDQVELRAGRHIVRPRYEITRHGRTRIAHPNVERADLQPDPGLQSLSNLLGRGFLLPFPILPTGRFRTEVQPTPMATTQIDLPLRLDVFAPSGRCIAEHFLGCLPRNHTAVIDLDTILGDALPDGGHGELVYDFRAGGSADGWMHALIRATDRQSHHAAETSFGAHIYNTPMTYRDEPQSYAGPPPGLSTRLFLRLATAGRRSYAVLIYPASAAWHPTASTTLILHDSDGQPIAERPLAVACSGSALIRPHALFDAASLQAADDGGYLIVRDTTCRLFGYHGLMDASGGFSLDHMFGF